MDIKKRYHDLQKASQTHLGWQWLLPLPPDDAYHLQSLNIPVRDEQCDLDGLVLSLTKILIDSLNEEPLKKMIPYQKREAFKDKSGIALLEAALNMNDLEGAEVHIAFLRKLESFRASGSADRKEQNYLKIAKHFGIENQNLQDVFPSILNSALDTLNYFIALVKTERIHGIIKQNHRAAADAIFKEMIGMADFGSTDASVNHDETI